jgi:hypothetical protein
LAVAGQEHINWGINKINATSMPHQCHISDKSAPHQHYYYYYFPSSIEDADLKWAFNGR